jgi:hypothetical protein
MGGPAYSGRTTCESCPNGFVLVYRWNIDGTLTIRRFGSAQTAGLIAALTAVGQTIGP